MATAPESYSPRTVAIVALGSLVVGFLVVFGGGLMMLRSHTAAAPGDYTPDPSLARGGVIPSGDAGEAAPTSGSTGTTGATPETPPRGAEQPIAVANPPTGTAPAQGGTGGGEAPPAPVVAAGGEGVTLQPVAMQRCYASGVPNAVPGSQCGRLVGLEQHLQSKLSEVAHCARSGSHGRLSLFVDFRFSTNMMTAWGMPNSTIANVDRVAACVKEKLSPLPLANITHDKDRYVLVIPIDW